MSGRKEPFVDLALDEWRMSGVERDWDAVLRAIPHRRRAALVLPQFGSRRRLLLALSVSGLVLITAPALAVLTDSTPWPWSSRPGASLAASVRTPSGTAELRLKSRGALIYRAQSPSTSKVKFLTPVAANRQRRFAWQLETRGSKVVSAAILIRGRSMQLCAPCDAHQTGAFTLKGVQALGVLNGGAQLRVQIDGRTASRQIRLRRIP